MALGVLFALVVGGAWAWSRPECTIEVPLEAASSAGSPAPSILPDAPEVGAGREGPRRSPEPEPQPPAPVEEPRDWRVVGSEEIRGLGPSPTRGFLRHRMVHFTFDDGPHLETTPRLLDALSEHGIKATFFVVGRQFLGPRGQQRRALVQRMADEGHTVAVHSHSHRDLRELSAEQIHQELDRSESSLEAILGHRPGLFRPPYGGRSRRSNEILRDRGYAQVLWNVPPEGGGARSPVDMARNFRRALDRQERHHRGPGAIVLLHDPNPASVAAFPLMVEELRARNCALLEEEGAELWDVVDDLSYHLLYGEELPADLAARRQASARGAASNYCAARRADAPRGS